MRIDVLTLFPEVFETFVQTSIVGRAGKSELVDIRFTNIREFTDDARGSVDDKPFGGGPGMVLTCGPVFGAVESIDGQSEVPSRRILLTPQGRVLTQGRVEALARLPRLLLICGHYEGFDERIRTGLGAEEISIGDYVLSGGEPAAMVLIDAVVRLLPGALGDEASARHDSFASGLLEGPHYTRPREFRGMAVPEVLLSGNHAEIEAWRRAQSIERTRQRRPDLLENSRRTDPE
ncbi:MAG: tRNA (guanosine(37)-N1)-methyltransferase TrmD [Planctomycetota bacterium]|nr:tRNA (guanosine(37)-N1)-methyltransferase TrmD [Planctomycetota bacterium]